MVSLDQTLSEVNELYRRVTGSPPPDLVSEVSIPPIPADVDPLEYVLREVQYLKDHLVARLGAPSGIHGTYAPPVDAVLTRDSLKISIDLPGMTREDVTLNTTGNMLVLRGARADNRLREQGQVLASERAHGTFERYIPLPPRVRIGSLKARLSNGVLEVEIPVVQEQVEQEKSIEIA